MQALAKFYAELRVKTRNNLFKSKWGSTACNNCFFENLVCWESADSLRFEILVSIEFVGGNTQLV